MSELPTGTVTFLFSDIEGSTRLLKVLGERYSEALAVHRMVLRESVAAHGGVEVDTQGDAFFVAFNRATDAVAAAQEAQARLATTPVQVRMGLHTGEPELTDDGYVGLDVHKGARIAASGHGGQVLLSQSTRDLIGADVEDLGLHRLKDLSAAQHLYQLGAGDFPPLRTLHETNLPVATTPFIGRTRELADVVALMADADVRLITLTGPGGVGKTRLAAQAAAEAFDGYPDGVWWVPLSAVRDPALVLVTGAQALGAREKLAQHIGHRRMLLVLDNFEQVVEAAPALAEVMTSCPNLELVVTSREPLHLTGEQMYPVPPFGLSEGVGFFVSRARAIEPGFERDDAVSEICRRLDGLPLALELAAARVKLLSARQILDRLGQRLLLLSGGARDLPQRQQTLRATIAWSYDLLTTAERRLFRRLAIFAGGCTVEAAMEVCDADLDPVQSLIDKSLLRRTGERIWMLETIREYALDKLSEDEGEDVRGRHAGHYIARAEANGCEPFEYLDPARVDWFESEQSNVRVALDWLHDHDAQPELECRLVVACARFWSQRGFWTEGRLRTEAALRHQRAASPRLRARLLSAGSGFASRQGDYGRAKELAQAALALGPELGVSVRELISAYNELGNAEHLLGHPAPAVEAYEQAAGMARAAGREQSLVTILANLGNAALDSRDFTRARPYFEESIVIGRRQNAGARVASGLCDLGFLALAQDRVDEAAISLRESLSLSRAERFAEIVVFAVEGLASVALTFGRPAEPTRLLAATTRPRAELGFGDKYYPIGDETRAHTLDSARAKLGEVAFVTAWEEGEAFSMEDAADEAALIP